MRLASLIAVLVLGSLCSLASPPDPAGLNPTHRISGSSSSRLSPGAVTVSGVLPGDTTWSGDVLVTGDVTVPAGATLTVAPGAVVRFAALSDDTAGGQDPTRCELIVHGTLSAEGTSAAPILFTSHALSPAPGDWYGIRATSTMVLRRCTIENCQVATELETEIDTDFFLSRCTIRQCDTGGIRVLAAGGVTVAVTIERCSILGTGSTSPLSKGVSIDYRGESTLLKGLISDSSVSNWALSGISVGGDSSEGAIHFNCARNTVENNAGGGIWIDLLEGSAVTIYDNTLTANDFSGIILGGRFPGTEALISNNILSDNDDYGILIWQIGSAILTDNEVQGTDGGAGIRIGGDGNYQLYRNRVNQGRSIGLQFEGWIWEGSFIGMFNQFSDNWGQVQIWQPAGPVYLFFNEISSSTTWIDLSTFGDAYVDARFNHWSDIATAEMNSSVYPSNISSIEDTFDDSDHGFVEYAGWLDAAPQPPTGPTSWITFPTPNLEMTASQVVIQGLSYAPAGVARVEVSFDDGTTWGEASGTSMWQLSWTPVDPGSYVIHSRTIDSNGLVETAGDGTQVAITANSITRAGVLSEDETWEGEVRLVGDLTVPPGKTLTILPGTTIRASSWSDAMASGTDPTLTELIIQGNLIATGTEELPVVFTAEWPEPMSQWAGIEFQTSPSNENTIQLTHCLIENAWNGLSAELCRHHAISVLSSTFNNCGTNGIRLIGTESSTTEVSVSQSRFLGIGFDGNSQGLPYGGINLQERYGYCHFKIDLRNNQFDDIGGYGIFAQVNHCDAAITGNSLVNIHFSAMELFARDVESSFSIQGNQVVAASSGIKCRNWGGGDVEILQNTISDCDFGIFVGVDGSLRIQGNHLIEISQTGIDASSNSHAFISWNRLEMDAYNAALSLHLASLGEQEPVRGIVVANSFADHSGGAHLSGYPASILMALNNVEPSESQYPFELTVTGEDVSAPWNYWGLTNTQEIENVGEDGNLSFIEDGHDHEGWPIVDISNWQHQPLPLQEAPLTRVAEPADGAELPGARIQFNGYALAPEGVDRVEISTDGGQTWAETAYVEPDIKELWTWLWFAPGDGTYTFRTRLVTAGEIVEKPGGAVAVTVTDAAPVNGDLNRDGAVNAADFDLLRAVLSDSLPPEPFDPAMLDVNGDGVVDVLDLVWLALLIAG